MSVLHRVTLMAMGAATVLLGAGCPEEEVETDSPSPTLQPTEEPAPSPTPELWLPVNTPPAETPVPDASIITTVVGSGPFGTQPGESTYCGWEMDCNEEPYEVYLSMNNGAFGGDGGPATEARLNWPTGVAVDTVGNLYISDMDNFRIRKVSAEGMMSTVAGTETGTGATLSEGMPATSAELGGPGGLSLDRLGNIFIADTWADRILKVSAAGDLYTVLDIEDDLFLPTGTAADEAGNVYIADYAYGCIDLVDPAGNFSYLIMDYNWIGGIALDGAGGLYFTENFGNTVWKRTAEGEVIRVAGDGEPGYSGDGGPATDARLRFPTGVAVNAQGEVFIADNLNNVIRKVSIDGIIHTVAGTGYALKNGLGGFSGDGGPANWAQLNEPYGVAIDQRGDLFIADAGNHRIRKVEWKDRPTTE